MNRLYTLINRFNRAKKGSVAVYFAISLVAIIPLIGAVVDYGRAMTLRTNIGAAADAAALATARDPDITAANMQARAEAFFNANTQNIPFGSNIHLTATELPGGDGVHIAISGTVETTIMGILGVPSITVSTESEAVFSTSKIELALVLDNTGSMGNQGKMATLKTASHDMIDQLLPDAASADNVKIGIVPFDIGVNVGKQYKNAGWLKHFKPKKKWKGCVGPRRPSHDVRDSNPVGSRRIPAAYGYQYFSTFIKGCDVEELLPLTNDKVALHQKITDMKLAGWTYIPEGLAWGWRILSSTQPFTQGAPYSDTDWRKVLVLMTDGANTTRWTWSGQRPTAHVYQSSYYGNVKTTALCENIKAEGITIYTVAFRVSSTSTRNMLQNCASNPNNFFNASNNAALEAAFAKIGGDINDLRLSR